MVRYALLTCLLLMSSACGSVYDGSYEGEARFVLNGSIVGLTNPPSAFVGEVLVHVDWRLIPVPLPPPSSGSGAAANAGAASPADPNSGTAGTAPSAPTTPAITSGSDGSVASVRFPAPLSLTLYDVPAVNKDLAALAVGSVTVFYDLDGNGVFSAVDQIAGAAHDHRLIYNDGSLPAADLASFGAQTDNFGQFGRGYILAAATCVGSGLLNVHAIANATVDFSAGAIAPCP